MIHLPEIELNFLKRQGRVEITFLYVVHAISDLLMYILFWTISDRFLMQIIIYSSSKYYTTDNIAQIFLQNIDKFINN